MKPLLSASLLRALLAMFASHALAQPAPTPAPDPFSMLAASASAGASQWGIAMLKFDRAWAITRGRGHIAFADTGVILPHEDLASGIDGPLRLHVSQDLTGALSWRYHATLTVGVAAARGMNGRGISGACPFCSVSLHNGEVNPLGGLNDALESGAAVVNYSAGGASGGSCATGDFPFFLCAFGTRAEERDVVFVSIAGNTASPYPAGGVPGGAQSVIVVAGLQSNGKFWTEGYESVNRGSDYGAGIRLVAPSKDVLTTHPAGGLYGLLNYRCGERVDSTLGEGPLLGPEYAGYGDCQGTSFSAPWVSALAALIRSANPLLTAAQVRDILYETAVTPVAGPQGSGLTFYIPDAEAAVRKAIGTGLRNRTTPMFSLFASSVNAHLFTSSPQTAVSAAAGELAINGLAVKPAYESFGNEVAGLPQFAGKICLGSACRRVAARSLFEVFTTENSPDGRELAPLYRLSLACTRADCPRHRTFNYATSAAAVRTLQEQGWSFDVIEGYVYAMEAVVPGALRLCLARDAARQDSILYAAPACDRSQLVNESGASTGGNYAPVAQLGYLPAATLPENHTGMWWNAAESGWGVNFSHQGDLVFATLFAYASDGRPLWVVMPEGRREGESETFAGPLYRVTGSPLAASTPPPVVASAVGDMRVTFSGDTATLEYVLGGSPVVKVIRKQVFDTRAASCRDAWVDLVAAANFQDQWFDANEPGWGLNVSQQDSTIFATLFTYDTSGRDLWYVMPAGQRQADGSFLGAFYRTRGSAFDAARFVPLAPADVTEAGALRLRFADGASGTMTFAPLGGAAIDKPLSRLVFSRPASGCRS
jgi:hypothetical protein